MTKNEKIGSTAAGIGLFVLSAVSAISLITGILDYGAVASESSSAIHRFGSMLYSVYGLSSVLIPAFLFVSGIFCLDSAWSLPKLFSLLISVVPFFTVAGAEHIARNIAAVEEGPICVFKITGIVFISLLLAALEYLGTAVLSGKLEKKLQNPRTFSDEDIQQRLKKATRKMKSNARSSSEEDLGFVDESEIEVEDGVTEAEIITDQDVRDDEGKSLVKKAASPEVKALALLPKIENPDSAIDAAVEKSIEEATDDTNWSLDDILKKHRKTLEETAEDLPSSDDIWSIDDEGEPKERFDSGEPTEVITVEEIESQSKKAAEKEGEIDIDADPWNVTGQVEEVNNDAEESVTEENAVSEDKAEEAVDEGQSMMSSDVFYEEPVVDETPEEDVISEMEQQNKMEAPDFSKKLDESMNEKQPEAPRTKAPKHSMISALDSVFAKMDEDAQADYKSGDLENHYDEDIEASEADDDIMEPMFDEEKDDLETETPDEEDDIEFLNPEAEEDMDTDPELMEDEENLSAMDTDEDAVSEEKEEAAPDFSKTAEITTIDENGNAVTSPIPKPEPKKQKKGGYRISTELLTAYEDNPYWIIDDETNQAAQLLKETLSEFKIEAEVTGIRKGPVVTMFEILPAPGVKLNKIVQLQDNIALRLAASSVRIVAPIPGKRAVGIEVPNKDRAIVSFRECIEQNIPEWKKYSVPVVLGKDIQGETKLFDLVKTPHLLIAGSTGSGKSVCVNSIIMSILYKRSPNEVKMILIDPKIVELKLYNDIPHLLTPVITEPKKAIQALQYCLCEMERRYALLDGLEVRDISTYNKKIEENKYATEKLPYLIVIIDEFADLMATTGKQLEGIIARLAAMSRAVGIHLVLATQRPSIDVITGLIKANIPSRIAFMVASKMDSRIILDQVGAEKLLGKGDMLYASATDPFPVRIQGTFISDQEVENVVEAVKQWGEPEYIDEEIFVDDEDEEGSDQMSLFNPDGEDPLYDRALEIVVQAGKASASYIQRRLKIGYNRAARLVEEMEERGIVGPANGSKPRELIHVP